MRVHVVLVMTLNFQSSSHLPQIKSQRRLREGDGAVARSSHHGRSADPQGRSVRRCWIFVQLLEWILWVNCGAFSQLARRPAPWAGSFSYLVFLLLLYDIPPVRHLLDRTELVAYAATYLVFQKSFGLCVRGYFWPIYNTYLFVYPEGRLADIDDRGLGTGLESIPRESGM